MEAVAGIEAVRAMTAWMSARIEAADGQGMDSAGDMKTSLQRGTEKLSLHDDSCDQR